MHRKSNFNYTIQQGKTGAESRLKHVILSACKTSKSSKLHGRQHL